MRKIPMDKKQLCPTHPTETDGGVCWHISKPDLPSELRYCQWKTHPDNIHWFGKSGVMFATEDDALITKYCSKCNTIFCTRPETELCSKCKPY